MPNTPLIEHLKQSYFFDSLAEEDLARLATMSSLQKFESGQLVFAEGDPAKAFYLLLSGQIQAYKIGPEGKEIILHLVEAGDVFAEHPIFGGKAMYPAYAMCLQPSEVLTIPGAPFKELVSDKPDILMRMLARFSGRIREFSRLIEDLSLHSVDARLARYLLTAHSEKAVIQVQKKTLAAILGTIPETLSRALKRLKETGSIQVNGNTIELLDRAQLEHLAANQ